MKLAEFVENLQELLDERPELADNEVIYSIDDEGNDYGLINWLPSLGNFNKKTREFVLEEDIIEDELDLPTNAILIN